MTNDVGYRLLDELLADPWRFDANGRWTELLQAYIAGLSLDTLQVLLRHEDVAVQRVAAAIVSEMGPRRGFRFLDDVIPLAASADVEVAYHATEALTTFSELHLEKFSHVLQNLEHDNDVIRRLSMRMASRVPATTLSAALTQFSPTSASGRDHLAGLALLIREPTDRAGLQAGLQAASAIVRRYAAVGARRFQTVAPELIHEAAGSDDGDVRRFAENELNPPSWNTRLT